MNRNITIIDKDYQNWINDLSSRYRRSQIKASVKMNNEMLTFYWSLGRDMLLNFIDTDLYERKGKALNNFTATLTSETSDLTK